MGFVGSEPSQASVSSAGILDGAIVDADINASAAIAISKTAFTAGTGITLSTNTVNVDAAQTGINSLLATDIKIGEDDKTKIDFEDANTINFYANNAKEVVLAENSISPGTNNGTALGTTSLMWSDLFLADGGVINFNNGDVILTHSSNLVTLTGGGLVVGVDDTGHDVKFFGASAGAYMEWDESADQLRIMGASADATTSTGKLLLATSLTDINANDVIGKIEFQAPHEAGGTDAITVAAGIEAVAQGTFSASVNSTDLIFKTGHSEAATEKMRITSQGEIGIGGTNYGTDGQFLTSGGAGVAPAWEDGPAGAGTFDATALTAISAGDTVGMDSDGKVESIGSVNGMATTSEQNLTAPSHAPTYIKSAWDPDNNRGLIVYKANNDGFAVAVAQNDGALTAGTPAAFDTSETNSEFCVVYDTSEDRFVIAYSHHASNQYNSRLKAIVADIDPADNSIDYGTAVDVHGSSSRSYMKGTELVACGGIGKVFLGGRIWAFDSGGSDTGTTLEGYILTVDNSDDSITAARTQVDASASWSSASSGWDENTDTIMFTGIAAASTDELEGFVGTVSGTTITWGSKTDIYTNISGSTGNPRKIIFDPSTSRLVMFFAVGAADSGSDGDKIHGMVGTGNADRTMTWGSSFVVRSDATEEGCITATMGDSDNGNRGMLAVHREGSSTVDIDSFVVNASNADVEFDGNSGAETMSQSVTMTSDNAGWLGSFYDTANNQFMVVSKTVSANTLRTLNPLIPYAVTSAKHYTNFAGIANSSISASAVGTITYVGGIGTGQSSLTPGRQYEIGSTGGLTIMGQGMDADATEFKIGLALTASTIYITGGTYS